MSKFCRSCGHALEDDASSCPACGNPTNREVAPKKKNNDILSKISEVILVIFCLVEKLLFLLVAKIGDVIKNAKNKSASGEQSNTLQKDSGLNIIRLAIVAVLIVIVLIGAIMNFTLRYEVTATATIAGEKADGSGPIGELAENDEFIGFIIVNILWGVFNVVLLIMGILLLLKVLRLENSNKNFASLTMIGLIGDALYIILYFICGSVTKEVFGITAKYSIGLHFFAWIHIAVFALTYASNFLNLNALIGGSGESAE